VEMTRDTGRPRFSVLEFPGAAFAAGGGTEHWRNAQGTYLARWEGFAERWSKHRLQDLQSTIDLAVRPWCALDPSELAQMQRKWMAGIVDRYVLDMLAFAKNAFSLPLGDIAPSTSARVTAVKPAIDGPAARHRAKRHEGEVT
jgi:hypothetical protein